MEGKNVRFAQLLELHINNVVKKQFKTGQLLTPLLMKEIHLEVRRQIDVVFEKSTHKLTPEARSWLTDQFFKVIQINGNVTMGDQVILNEYKLSSLPYHDVELLRNLFNETDLAGVLNEEYQRRSQS